MSPKLVQELRKGLYGDHADLYTECAIAVLRPAIPADHPNNIAHVTLTHNPTGTVLQARGKSQYKVIKQLLQRLAEKLRYVPDHAGQVRS